MRIPAEGHDSYFELLRLMAKTEEERETGGLSHRRLEIERHKLLCQATTPA